MPALSDHDKGRCRRHLGYLSTNPGMMWAGVPQPPAQTAFILEQRMNALVDDQAVEYCQELLCRCDKIEREVFELRPTAVASELGKLKLHPGGRLATDNMRREYIYQVGLLADHLGAPKYPYAERFARARGGPGTMVPVVRR